MILCFRCKRISPASSDWCAFGCGSFGGHRCSRGHLSPVAGVRCCTTCGSSELSEHAPALNLRPVTRIVAWAVTLGVLKLILSHLGAVAGTVGAFGMWSLAHIFGLPALGIYNTVVYLLAWVAVASLLSFALPEPYGGNFRAFLFRGVSTAAVWTWRGIVALTRSVLRLVESNARPNGKD